MSNSALHDFSNKTRVSIVTNHQSIAKFIIHVLEFNQKSIFYQLEGESLVESPGSDFVLVEHQNLEKAAEFEPNIVLVTTSPLYKQYQTLLNQIVNGGILVYPAKALELHKELKTAPSFFRKIPYEVSILESHYLKTSIGSIPLTLEDEILIEHLEGLQHLLQHLGIMEEEFYEALMAFEMQS
ncbi:hypothetical protein [Chryseobacterium sp. A301]